LRRSLLFYVVARQISKIFSNIKRPATEKKAHLPSFKDCFLFFSSPDSYRKRETIIIPTISRIKVK